MAQNRRSFFQVAKSAWKEATRDNIGLIAAGVAFYGFLAFVPLIAAIILAYGLVADPADAVRHGQALTVYLPGNAADLVRQQLSSVASANDSATGLGLLLALATSLYGGMRGAKSIIIALNVVHEVEETRGFFVQLGLAAAITLALVGTALLALLAISALGFLESLIPSAAPWLINLIRAAFWSGAAVAAAVLLSLVYRYGPHRDPINWRVLLPGAVAATLGWLAVTFGFGIYVSNFGNYNATYGALGAVVVLLMWLYFSAYVLLLGAEVNAARKV